MIASWRIQLTTSSEFSKSPTKRSHRSCLDFSHPELSLSWLKLLATPTWMMRSMHSLVTTLSFSWKVQLLLSRLSWLPRWRQWLLRRKRNRNWFRRIARSTKPKWKLMLNTKDSLRRTPWRTERLSKLRRTKTLRVMISGLELTWSSLSHHLSKEKDDELRELNRDNRLLLLLTLVELIFLNQS